MPADRPDPEIRAGPGSQSMRPGDVPDAVRRRYLTEGERLVAFYTDALTRIPSLRDRGDVLFLARNDPNALRDAAAIAAHRGWSKIEVRGPAAFRREAWMALRSQGLEVTGFRPTARDQQALERQNRPRHPVPRDPPDHPRSRRAPNLAPERMRVVETLVQRIRDPDRRERVLAQARERLAAWVERGAPPDALRDRQRLARDRQR